jgi:cytochrome b6-f complex iron-sulfur subunit
MTPSGSPGEPEHAIEITKKASRRDALRTIAAATCLTLGWHGGARRSAVEIQIAKLTDFANEYDSVIFDYEKIKSLAVRLPAPKRPNPNVLEIDKRIYLTAYTLVCTHNGCEPQPPNLDRLLVCPCHLMTFNTDGSSLGGLTDQGLRNIQLEVRQGQVYAVGWS